MQQAISVLWYRDNQTPGILVTPGEIAKAIRDAGLGNPNSTQLGRSMIGSKHAVKSGAKLRLKPTSREIVRNWLQPILGPTVASVDNDNGYLPMAVWAGTRGYIEKIAKQVNGCYQHGYFDAASVLVRRLIETLLIECYEHLNIESKIRKTDGNYPMLSDIITGAVDNLHLSLGRETKNVLKEIKTTGDRAAHNRRYNAVKADLDKMQSGVRLAVDELLHLAGFK
ncbi:MAG: hypothetical protein R3C59_16825 [Planctomycetaceae bacterium]